MIRIVIPAYKAETTIVACVMAVLNAAKNLLHYEIVITDNGGNPNLEKLLAPFPVRLISCTEKASAAYARNKGAEDLHKGILVFIDSDVIIETNTLEELIFPIQKGKAHASIGNYSKKVTKMTFAQQFKQLYIHTVYLKENQEIKNDYWTAIAAVDITVFHELKGFDTSFSGANGEDQEFGIRLTQHGYTTAVASKALGKHLKTYTLNGIIENDYKKGLRALKNSQENQVPLSDNRHAKKEAILAVFTACMGLLTLLIGIVFPITLVVALICFISWWWNRRAFFASFHKAKGIQFSIKAGALLFVLELVRASCVISHLFTTFIQFLKPTQKTLPYHEPSH